MTFCRFMQVHLIAIANLLTVISLMQSVFGCGRHLKNYYSFSICNQKMKDLIPNGLLNTGYSCYANSVLQMLLSSGLFVKSLYKKSKVKLNHCLLDIVKKKSINSDELRKLVDKKFTKAEEQDACDFLNKMIKQQTFLKKNGVYVERYYLCKVCKYTKQKLRYCQMVILETHSKREKVKFRDLFYFQPTKIECEKCKDNGVSNFYVMKKIIKDAKGLIFLVIKPRREVCGKKISTKFTGFNYSDFRINDKHFEVRAVIKHKGKNVMSGHYISVVRNKGRWFYCNDENIKTINKFDKTLKNVVIIMLNSKSEITS